MSENREVLLKVENLSQFFGFTKAVDDVSFEIMKGEVFGLVGESGCGKTTTGRSIIKLYNITGGNVFFKGIRIAAGKRVYKEEIERIRAEWKEKLASDPVNARQHNAEYKAKLAAQQKLMREADKDQRNCDKIYSKQLQKQIKEKYAILLEGAEGEKKKQLQAEFREALRKARKTKLVTQIQMIFQDPIASLDPRMTVKEIISEGLVIQGERDKAVLDEKVYEMLELVGLVREHASRYPHEFSGGQRQRIGIARALVVKPKLIIADEPVSALDVSIQAQVINLLNDLKEELGLTIIFIAHDLSVVKYFSSRVAVMYYGKIVEMAPSETLYRHPIHPYTRALLSAVPQPNPRLEKQRTRLVYDPKTDHIEVEGEERKMYEIEPEHFVYCNSAELEAYKKML